MVVFYFLLIVPILIQHIAIKEISVDYNRRNRLAIAFFFVVLTVLVMFRHECIGNDTSNYIYFFNSFARLDWSRLRQHELELGYALFNKLVSLVSDEPRFFLAVSSITVSVMIYPTYKRLCVDASLTIVLYCIMSTFVMMFSGIRQMLAVGLGFVAYEYTRNRKLIPFVLVVVLAMTCHASAFMLAVMYPLYHARITKQKLLAIAPLLLVVYIMNRQIFSVLTIILARFSKYDGELSSTGAYSMMILFVIFVAFAYIIPDESKVDNEVLGLRNFLLLAFVIQMFAPLHVVAMRMNYYYIIFIPLLLPKIIEARNKRWNQVAVFGRHVMVVFFLMYFFMNAYGGGGLNVFPYHFFWENV